MKVTDPDLFRSSLLEFLTDTPRRGEQYLSNPLPAASFNTVYTLISRVH